MHDNLASLAIQLSPAQLRTLDEGSALDLTFPCGIFTPTVNKGFFGGTTVRGWQ